MMATPGEEVGMQNMRLADFDATSDWPLRGPMSWAAQPSVTDNTRLGPFADYNYFKPAPNIATYNVALASADPASLWGFYRTLLNLRKTNSALQEGSFRLVKTTNNTLVFERADAQQSVVLVINYGSTGESLQIATLPAGVTYVNLFNYQASLAPLQTPSNGAAITLAAPARSIQAFSRALP